MNWSHSGIRMRQNFWFNIYFWSYSVWDRKMSWNRFLYKIFFSFLVSINGKNKQTKIQTKQKLCILFTININILIQISKVFKKMAVLGCNFHRHIVKHSLRQKSTYSRPWCMTHWNVPETSTNLLVVARRYAATFLWPFSSAMSSGK